MKKKTVLLVLGFAFVLPLVGAGCASSTAPENDAVSLEQIGQLDVMIDEGKGDTAVEETDQAKAIFALSGKNFAFMMDGQEAPVLKVKKGTTAHIDFTSESGFHDWVLDEFGAATDRVQTGETVSVEFVADQVGTYEYYCSVGAHRANGMIGTFIVE